MLGDIFSKLIPSDPAELILSYIDGQPVTITVGEKLTLKFTLKKEREEKLETGAKAVTYRFDGELVRRG